MKQLTQVVVYTRILLIECILSQYSGSKYMKVLKNTYTTQNMSWKRVTTQILIFSKYCIMAFFGYYMQ